MRKGYRALLATVSFEKKNQATPMGHFSYILTILSSLILVSGKCGYTRGDLFDKDKSVPQLPGFRVHSAVQEVLQLKNAKRNSNSDSRAPTRRPSGYRTCDWDTPSWKRRRVAANVKPEAACDRHYEAHREIPHFSLCCSDFPDSWPNPSRTPSADDALPGQRTHGSRCGDDLQRSMEKSSEENLVSEGFYVRTLLEQQKERQRRGSFRPDKDGARPEKAGKFVVQKLLRKAIGETGVDTRRLRSGDLRYGTLGRESTESAAEVRLHCVELHVPQVGGWLSAPLPTSSNTECKVPLRSGPRCVCRRQAFRPPLGVCPPVVWPLISICLAA